MVSARRDILRVGGVVTTTGLAGCFIGSGCVHTAEFTLVPASAAELTERLATQVTRAGSPDQRLVRSAIDAETTYRACYSPSLEDIYVVDRSYYRLTSGVTKRQPATQYALKFEIHSPETLTPQPAADQIIAFEKLPQIDQRTLQRGLLNELHGKVEDPAQLTNVSGNAEICYPTDAIEDSSVLVPSLEYQYIRYKGLLIELSLGESSSTTLKTFRIQAEEIASSPTAFAQYADEHLLDDVVNLDEASLSQQQETILTKAIQGKNEEGMSTCVDDPSPAFEELIRTIFDVGEDFKHFVPEQPGPVIWKTKQYLATYTLTVA